MPNTRAESCKCCCCAWTARDERATPRGSSHCQLALSLIEPRGLAPSPSACPRVHAPTAPSAFDAPPPAFQLRPSTSFLKTSCSAQSPSREEGAVTCRASSHRRRAEAQNSAAHSPHGPEKGAAGRAACNLAWCSDRKPARPTQKPCQLGARRGEKVAGGRRKVGLPRLRPSALRSSSTIHLL